MVYSNGETVTDKMIFSQTAEVSDINPPEGEPNDWQEKKPLDK